MLDSAGRGSARAEDAQGTPTQSHLSTSILENTNINPKRTNRSSEARAHPWGPGRGGFRAGLRPSKNEMA